MWSQALQTVVLGMASIGWPWNSEAQGWFASGVDGPPGIHPLQIRAGAVFLERPSPANLVPFGVEGEETWVDLDLGWAAGPEIRLGYEWPSGWGLGVRYFHVDGWEGGLSDTAFSGEDQFPISMSVQMLYTSRLYSTELNLYRRLGERISIFSGFRWIELHEKANAQIEFDFFGIPEVSLGFGVGLRMSNYLYGYQIGAEGNLPLFGRLQLEGAIRAGIFGGPSRGSVTVYPLINGIAQPGESGSGSDHKTFFVGEIALLGKYHLAEHAILYGGYQVLWLDGVALASQQTLQEQTTSFRYSTAFYHGPIVGLEIRW
ncbi:MAG: hypothetical protein NZ602_14130 [Thermoguttaceae bacterium]|nr:hypothetical protein [Thermoguttaceae bacterium]MDW8036967.1 hypothetical protein [Thermoguttaceae bacterium]